MKNILENEILMALGCTEPIAVSYASAAAYDAIGGENISSVECLANGNIIKNATSVIIPNSNGLYGMKAAVACGIAARAPELKLEVLSVLNEEKLQKVYDLLSQEKVSVKPFFTDKAIYIKVKVVTENGYGEAVIENSHDNVVWIGKNGETLLSDVQPSGDSKSQIDYSLLNLEKIYNYINEVSLDELEIIRKAIEINKNICGEGLKNDYGLSVAKALNEKTLSKYFTSNPISNSIKITAAGTDARMAGCNLPAMSNSGSGNQGIATTMPVVGYGESIGATEERLLRAVALSNLVTIYVKSKLGRLSSLCGAVNAAAGSSCGIVYLNDGKIEDMEKAIHNVMGNIAGMFCDGAKAGCGLKIATGTFTAILSAHKALEGSGVSYTDGIVGRTVEETLENYGRISQYGLKELDSILLDIMVNK